MNRRLGLFGGTFDPPHLGHLAALRAVWATHLVDHILVTVAGDPYLKSGTTTVASAEVRLAMAHAAFDGLPGVEVSDLEVRREGPTYTIDTVEALSAEGTTISLIVGADVVGQLPRWREAARLAELVDVVVLPRDGSPTTLPPGWRGSVIDMDPVDVSSTEVRRRLENGENPADLVPASVVPWLTEGDG
ncbi:MAG: nicotinate (nicotinamide) nucleotide adenylyltransferase [Acidobacteria bacterium]|nr:nicotinate (nicotinamide) nucleotide adenylyltransferase [Acidobacteriota bacterium]